LSRRLARVHLRRVALVDVVIPRQQLRAGVDAAAVLGLQIPGAVAVEDLDLVDGLELHARVRALRHVELEREPAAAEAPLRRGVPAPAGRALSVEEHRRTMFGRRPQLARTLRVELHVAHGRPAGVATLPGVEN